MTLRERDEIVTIRELSHTYGGGRVPEGTHGVLTHVDDNGMIDVLLEGYGEWHTEASAVRTTGTRRPRFTTTYLDGTTKIVE